MKSCEEIVLFYIFLILYLVEFHGKQNSDYQAWYSQCVVSTLIKFSAFRSRSNVSEALDVKRKTSRLNGSLSHSDVCCQFLNFLFLFVRLSE